MKKLQSIILLSIALIYIPLYQNCAGGRFSASNDTPLSDAKQSSANGQPYDGKIYISADSGCPDGTFVQSRVVLKNSKSATLVRDNCQNINRDLGANDFFVDPIDPDKIHYNNKTYVNEKPYTPIPILSAWYLQLTGVLQSYNSLVYDVDMFDTSAAEIQALKQAGHLVICNISAGTFENWRSDAGSFSAGHL